MRYGLKLTYNGYPVAREQIRKNTSEAEWEDINSTTGMYIIPTELTCMSYRGATMNSIRNRGNGGNHRASDLNHVAQYLVGMVQRYRYIITRPATWKCWNQSPTGEKYDGGDLHTS